MQIILQKSKVYLIFCIFLSKILSIFTINTTHGRLITLSRPLCSFVLGTAHLAYLVTLPHFLSRHVIYLLPAKDEYLAVDEHFACDIVRAVRYILYICR